MSQSHINTDIYTDPDEDSMKRVLEELKGLDDHSKIHELILKTFPTWLVHVTSTYSEDYPHLDKNWRFICEKTGVSKQQIVIVDDIVKDDDHLLINIFCERMAREGYIVRRKREFIGCQVCGAAIPSESVFNHMKDNSLPTPDVWSNKCLSCERDV